MWIIAVVESSAVVVGILSSGILSTIVVDSKYGMWQGEEAKGRAEGVREGNGSGRSWGDVCIGGKKKVGIGESCEIQKRFFDGLESTTELAVDSRVISKPRVDSSGIHRRQSCAGRL